MTSQARVAGLFFFAGVAFLAALESFPTRACNDSCPPWFTGLVMAQLLTPAVWAMVGFFAPPGRRVVWLLAVSTLSASMAFAIHKQTLNYTIRAISG